MNFETKLYNSLDQSLNRQLLKYLKSHPKEEAITLLRGVLLAINSLSVDLDADSLNKLTKKIRKFQEEIDFWNPNKTK